MPNVLSPWKCTLLWHWVNIGFETLACHHLQVARRHQYAPVCQVWPSGWKPRLWWSNKGLTTFKIRQMYLRRKMVKNFFPTYAHVPLWQIHLPWKKTWQRPDQSPWKLSTIDKSPGELPTCAALVSPIWWWLPGGGAGSWVLSPWGDYMRIFDHRSDSTKV